MSNPFTILQPGLPALPCDRCKCECCSGIPLTQRELDKIVTYLRGRPVQELDRLAAQHRDKTTCMFVDTEKWQCSVYGARPLVCELFGRVPNMVCSYAPGRAKEFTQQASDRTVIAHMTVDHEWVCLTAFSFFGKVTDIFLTWPKLKNLLQRSKRALHAAGTSSSR